jgi:hypothetical protein
VTIVGTNPHAVIGGVDTHAEVHVAAVINHVGGVLGVESFPTTIKRYAAPLTRTTDVRGSASQPHLTGHGARVDRRHVHRGALCVTDQTSQTSPISPAPVGGQRRDLGS